LSLQKIIEGWNDVIIETEKRHQYSKEYEAITKDFYIIFD
jgi:hypothetical protein